MQERNIKNLHDNPALRRPVSNMIKDSAEFEPHMTARIVARLSLPPRRLGDRIISEPVVRSVRVTLPDGVMVPPSTVRLHSITKSQAENQALDQYLQIDTRAGSLDWFGGPMTVGPSADDAPRVYEYDPIDVQFLQPGELFRQHEIRVDVDVELPNELTSGAQVRFFGATG